MTDANNPLGTPDPPPMDTGTNPNAPPSGNAAGMPSEWVSGTLRDSALYRDFISFVEEVRSAIYDVFQAIIDVLEIIVALMEALKTILQLLDSLIAIAVKAVIALLQQLKDAFIQWLEDMLGIGFYFLPHFLTFNWDRAIREMLLNPYGVGANGTSAPGAGADKHFNPGQIVPVPDILSPGKFTYQAVTMPGKKGVNFEQFVDDVEKAFGNTNDRLRPVFSSYMGVSGVVVAIAFDDVFVFVRITCFLLQLVSGKNYGYKFARWVAEKVYPALGLATAEGIATPEAIESANKFLCDLEEGGVDSVIAGIGDSPSSDALAVESIKFEAKEPGGYSDMNLAVYSFDPASYLFVPVKQGAAAGYFGNWRAPLFNYTIDVKTKGTAAAGQKIFLFAQRQCGARFAYGGATGSKMLGGTPRGILLGELAVGEPNPMSGMTAPLEYSNCDDPELFDPSLAVDASVIIADVDPPSASAGQWYLNVSTNTIRRYTGSNWYNAASPNAYIFTVADQADNVLARFVAYVVRFKLRNESVVVGGVPAYYVYGDNFPLGVACSLTLHHSALMKIGVEMGIAQRDVEARLGLPYRRGSGGGTFGFSNAGISSYADKLSAKIEITKPANILPDAPWYVVYNHKVAIRGGAGILSGGFWSSYFDRWSEEGNKIIVELQGAAVSEDLSAIEVCGESTQTILPTMPGGGSGGTAMQVSFTAFGRLATYVIDRDPPATSVTVLTPTTVSPQQVDDMFIARIAALDSSLLWELVDQSTFQRGSGAKKMTADLLKSTLASNNVAWAGNVFWRGYKPAKTGILVWSTKTQSATCVIPPDDKTSFRNVAPTALQVGTHVFKIYAFGQAVWNGVGATPEAMRAAVSGKSPEQALKPSGTPNITEALQFTVTVTGNVDPRDIPGGLAWRTLSLKRWINIVDPLDRFLQQLIDSIPIPPSVFQGLINWIDRMERRIKYWEAVIKAIQEYIDRILRLLDIGNTGFYFLAIENAAGTEGFVNRMTSVQAPPELTERPYCTGVVMVAAQDYGGAQLMSGLFDWCPRAKLEGEEDPGQRPSFNDIAEAWYAKLAEDSAALAEQAGKSFDSSISNVTSNYEDIRRRLANVGNARYEQQQYKDSDAATVWPSLFVPKQGG